jgi:acyl-coenzyme A synthetase/AMP-(fatty) acid ligase
VRGVVLGGLSLPTFHAMGVLFHVLYPLLTGYPTAMYTPQAPAPPIVTAPDVALRALKDVGANIVLVAPAFLEVGWSGCGVQRRMLNV